MKESVAIAKEADAKKEFSSTKSDKSIHRVRDEPKRQLGPLMRVIGDIRRDGDTPSAESIATQLSSMHTTQRASALLALQQTHGNRYVQRVVMGIQAKLKVGQPGDIYEKEADRVADEVMKMSEPGVQLQNEPEEDEELFTTETLEQQLASEAQIGTTVNNVVRGLNRLTNSLLIQKTELEQERQRINVALYDTNIEHMRGNDAEKRIELASFHGQATEWAEMYSGTNYLRGVGNNAGIRTALTAVGSQLPEPERIGTIACFGHGTHDITPRSPSGWVGMGDIATILHDISGNLSLDLRVILYMCLTGADPGSEYVPQRGHEPVPGEIAIQAGGLQSHAARLRSALVGAGLNDAEVWAHTTPMDVTRNPHWRVFGPGREGETFFNRVFDQVFIDGLVQYLRDNGTHLPRRHPLKGMGSYVRSQSSMRGHRYPRYIRELLFGWYTRNAGGSHGLERARWAPMEPERVARELRNAWLEHYQLQYIGQEIQGLAQQQETSELEEQAMRMPKTGCSECEEEELIMAKTISRKTPGASDDLQARLNQLKGGGQVLPESMRAFFEPRFGYDFSQVRVHLDSRAAEAAEVLNARAFTIGQDMVFGVGQYAPWTERGQRLLAHELTHVVQQNIASSNIANSASTIQRLDEDDLTSMTITRSYARSLTDEAIREQIQILDTQIILEEYATEEELATARSNLCILQEEASTRNFEISQITITTDYARDLTNEQLMEQIQILETQIILEEYDEEEEREVAQSNLCILQEEASTRNFEISQITITTDYARDLTNEQLMEQIQILETQIILEEYDEEEEREVAQSNLCILQEEASTRNLELVPERQVQFERGALTIAREGPGPNTLRIHWPRTENSGVTLGYGYDLGARTEDVIRTELQEAGLEEAQINFLVQAASLRGEQARVWCAANEANPLATITSEQRLRLFQLILPRYAERAQRRATRGRGVVISQERWDQLNPVITELLTDLAYVGAPYAGARRGQINSILTDESLSTLEQLRRLRSFVESLPANVQGPRGRQLRLDFIDDTIRQLE